MKKLSVWLCTVPAVFLLTGALALFAGASNEVWQMSGSSMLYVRESASTSSDRVTSIPAGTKYTITSKTSDSSYVWGKVTYNGVTGWCALNYSTYISGNLYVPKITNTAAVYETSATIRWGAVNTADSYTVNVYNSSGALYKTYTGSALYRVISLSPAKYTVTVTAKNKLVPGWSATSAAYTFTLRQSLVSSITVSGASSVVKGSKTALSASVLPNTAIDKSVSWSSSDTKVATVSSTGVVTGVGYGKAVITCAANDAGKKKATYTVSVSCANGTTPYQVISYTNNTASSVWIRWNAVPDATGYALYKYNASTKKYEYYRATAATQYVATGLSAGSTEYFRVRPYVKTASGNIYSGLSAFCRAAVLPAAPTGLAVTGLTKTSVSFKWNAVYGATSYAIYKYNSANKKYEQVTVVSSTQYTAKVYSGELCYFKVRPIKLLNSRSWYGTASTFIKVTSVVSAPTLSVSRSGASAVLSWNAVTGATGYEAYFSSSPGGSYKLISITDSSTRSLIKYSLASGKTYYFRVRAYNTTGNVTGYSSYSAVKSVTIP